MSRYKITNKSRDNRRIRQHKVGKMVNLRPGETVYFKHPPVVANPHYFEVIDLEKETKEEKSEVKPDKKSSKKRPTKQTEDNE